MDKKIPKISIIVPSLNQSNFITKTINSILEQNYPNLEIIVMDGGSTDDTISILENFGSKIKWISEKDRGQSHAINKGIDISSGEILGFINSDDYILPGALNLIAETFKDEHVYWVTGDYKIVDSNGIQIQSTISFYKRVLRMISSKKLLLITNYIIQPSTFWRKSLNQKIGGFDESLRYVMDYDFWIKAFNIATPKIIRKPLSAFRIHKLSKGGSQYKKQFEEELMVCKKYSRNWLLIIFHSIHNQLILFVYKIIK